MTMSGLTLWRPWSDAIVRGPKRVENRVWAPPLHRLGEYIAIHAGKRYDPHAARFARHLGVRLPAEADSPTGIVGVARLAGIIDANEDGDPHVVAGLPGLHVEIDADWWMGNTGWVLDEVTAIEPVECRGAQGLWPLPREVERVVRERWEVARGA